MKYLQLVHGSIGLIIQTSNELNRKFIMEISKQQKVLLETWGLKLRISE